MADCAGIENWSAEGLQNVIGTMDGIHQEHVKLGDTLNGVEVNLSNWGGQTAEAWRGFHGKLRTDVDEQGRQAKAVADALRPLYDEVLGIKSKYRYLKSTIENNGSYNKSGELVHWKLQNDGSIDTSGAPLGDLQSVAAKQQLEDQMKALLRNADDVDLDIANAFKAITSGEIPTTGHHAGEEPPKAPEPDDGYKPVTATQLMSIVPEVSEAKANEMVGPLNDAMRQGGMNTPLRQAAFISQVAVESDRFATTREYADGSEYEGRCRGPNGLGNCSPGDGVKYAGRGYIQLTGKDNYAAASKALGVDLVNNPELAETPEYAFKVSVYYWDTHGGNAVSDTGNIADITQMVNGGDHGLAARTEYFNKGLEVLGR